jgi:hypothetical protein
MQTTQLNPRKVIERALACAPEPVLSAMADVFTASEQPSGDRTVIVRHRRNGETVSETLTSAPETIGHSEPIDLLEAFRATGQPYYEALERGLEARKKLLAAEGGVMSAAEVANYLGITRQAVDKRRRAGRLLGVTTGRRGYVYPAWQFADQGTLPGFEEVLSDLSDHDPWMQIIFMLEPDLWLEDLTPLSQLRLGRLAEVRKAAQMLGVHGAA